MSAPKEDQFELLSPGWPTCACGCGRAVPAYKHTDLSRSRRKGQPARYVKGHSGGPAPLDWSRITITEKGCHVFADYEHPSGKYRTTRYRGESYPVYRMVWVEANGDPGPGYDVHHRCENKACVNLAHLELLTSSEHMLLHRRLDRERRADRSGR